MPKRLRGLLADRPPAVAVLTKIFLTEIERLLLAVAGGTPDADLPRAARPRLGGISFLHRFGSALNRHVHLHACVTDGVFVLAAAEGGTDAPPTFLPARPMTPADLATLTERVRIRIKSPARTTPHDAKGQAHGAGGGGVSARVPSVRRRHPAERRRPAGAGSREVRGSQAEEGQDAKARVKVAPHASWRTARAATGVARSWPAHRLRRARADP